MSALITADQYDIFSWCEHLGATGDSGHYTAIARHIDGKFRRYSSSIVAVPCCDDVMCLLDVGAKLCQHQAVMRVAAA